MSSAPPPSSSAPAAREFLASSSSGGRRRWRRRRAVEGAAALQRHGAVLECDAMLRAPLRLVARPAPARRDRPRPGPHGRQAGRFPILRRLGPDGVRPARGGRRGLAVDQPPAAPALTIVGDEEEAPNAALLFTKPLGEDIVTRVLPARLPRGAGRALAARRPGRARPAAPRRRDDQGRERLPAVRPAAPLTDREVAADAAALAADRPPGRPDRAGRRRRAAPPPRSRLPAWAEPRPLTWRAMSALEPYDPERCRACRAPAA